MIYDISGNRIDDQLSSNSVYQGKTLSILGDSISTFAGYIPSGNLTYYPKDDVTSVNDTWWKKLIDGLGMTLNVNNSWSGSRVTTTDGETSAGCMDRCQHLGTNPDVIIVYMGINDYNNEVGLGTYTGKTAVPSVTTTFREAYAVMLDKILTAYPNSEVWCCTLPQCERNGESGFPELNGNDVALSDYNEAIKELADTFGVRVLHHHTCGLTYHNMSVYNPNELHPNKNGHSLMANNDLREMITCVPSGYFYGKSAYELAVDGGYSGTQAQWLESLKGDAGDSGIEQQITISTAVSSYSIKPNNLYVFPEESALTITFDKTGIDTSVVNDFHFTFVNGSTACELVLPETVNVGELNIRPNTVCEVSIVNNLLSFQNWSTE